MSSIGYRPEIDGLRAFAVVPVILFHMGYQWMAGGFIGVDVFFVISGFLITSIVMREIEQGTFSFREFWVRRVRRILPALLVVSLTTLTVAFLLASKGDHPTIGQQALFGLFSLANIYFWHSTGDYWGTQAEESPFLHTWSLSVEEQFYTVFPVLIWLVIRYKPQWLKRLLWVVILASLGLFLYGTSAFPTATFYLLPTRAWELAAGCYLGVAFRHRSERANSPMFAALAVAGLALVLACYCFLPTLNGGVIFAIVGSALVIAFGHTGLCHIILTQRHIVHIGKISYSLYLWHWPLLVFADLLGYHSYQWVLFVPLYLLAVTSYHLVEQSTRRRQGVLPSIGMCYLLAVGFSTTLALSPGLYDTSAFAKPHWYGLYYDLRPRNDFREKYERIIASIDAPPREAPPDAYLNGGIIVGTSASPPRVVVLGDSHGVMWSDAIRHVTEKLGIKTSFYSMNGVTPFMDLPLSREQKNDFLTPEEKYNYDKARLDSLEAWKPDLVILCAKWSSVTESEAADLLDFLEEHSAKVLLIEQPPELTFGNRNALQVVCSRKIDPTPDVKKYLPMELDKWEMSHFMVRCLASKYRNCDFIPTSDLFVQGSEGLILDGLNVVYVDDDHLTTHGARLAIPRFEQKISEALKVPEYHPERGLQMAEGLEEDAVRRQ